MSPPGIQPGLPQPQCGVIATTRRRQDLIIQKNEILTITILYRVKTHKNNINTITSIGTLELLVKETLKLRPFNLSAAFPRSTIT
jgi:hypothetical protein